MAEWLADQHIALRRRICVHSCTPSRMKGLASHTVTAACDGRTCSPAIRSMRRREGVGDASPDSAPCSRRPSVREEGASWRSGLRRCSCEGRLQRCLQVCLGLSRPKAKKAKTFSRPDGPSPHRFCAALPIKYAEAESTKRLMFISNVVLTACNCSRLSAGSMAYRASLLFEKSLLAQLYTVQQLCFGNANLISAV